MTFRSVRSVGICVVTASLLFAPCPSSGLAVAEDNSRLSLVVGDFTTRGGSIDQDKKAAAVSDILRVKLTESPGFVTVDREHLGAIVDEMHLQAVGDVSDLVLGKQTNADLLLRGSFEQADDEVYLDCDVTDLHHADVLVAQRVPLEGRTFAALTISDEGLNRIERVIADMLDRGCRELQARKTKTRIAPLFFHNSTSSSRRLDFVVDDLMDQFRKPVDGSQKTRFLCFPAAEDAISEAELVLGAFTDLAPDEWNALADYYVWGSIAEEDSDDVPFKDLCFVLNVKVWHISGVMYQFERRSRLADLKEFLPAVVRAIANIGEQTVQPSQDKVSRKALAETVFKEATAIQDLIVQLDNNYQASPTWIARRKRAVEFLALASFLDPADEDIRAELLLEKYREDASRVFANESTLKRKLQQIDAWQKHIDMFGLDYYHPHMHERVIGLADNRAIGGTVGEILVITILNELDRFQPRRSKRLKDLPEACKDQLRERLESQLLKTVELVAAQKPEAVKAELWLSRMAHGCVQTVNIRIAIIETLWPHVKIRSKPVPAPFRRLVEQAYGAAGYARGAEDLLREWPGHDVEHRAETVQHANELSVKPTKSISPTQVANALPRLDLEPRACFLKKHMWPRSTDAIQGSAVSFASVHGQRFSGSPTMTSITFMLDNETGDFGDILLRQRSRAHVMTLHNGDLWIGFENDGVWRVSTRDRSVEKFAARDGLGSHEVYSFARQGHLLYFGGANNSEGLVLSKYDSRTSDWSIVTIPSLAGLPQGREPVTKQLACNGDWILAYADLHGAFNHLVLFNTITKTWKDLTPRMRQTTEDRRFKVTGLASYGDGFFLGSSDDTRSGLLHLRLEPEQLTVVQPPLLREVTAMHSDGKLLWVGWMLRTSRRISSYENTVSTGLAIYDPASRTWLGTRQLPWKGTVESISSDGKQVCLGLGTRGKQDIPPVVLIARPAL